MAVTLERPAKRPSDDNPRVDAPVDVLPERKRFTRDEFHLLPQEVFQRQGRRYELINGDIIEKMGQKEPHIGLLLRWVKALIGAFGIDHVRYQMPVVINDDTELEPDISVATKTNDTYLDAGETTPAADVRLVVEISVSSRTYDTVTKAIEYAGAMIPEYWVLDIASRVLIVHRDPNGDGYATVFRVSEVEVISPLSEPEATFLVSDYLP